MTYEIVENILILLGLGFMMTSMIKYYRRTGDKGLVKKIWFMKLELSKSEYLLNRIGLYLLIMGIIIRFMNNLMI